MSSNQLDRLLLALFFFVKIVLALQVPLPFHINFRIILLMPTKILTVVLREIVINLYISLGKTDSFPNVVDRIMDPHLHPTSWKLWKCYFLWQRLTLLTWLRQSPGGGKVHVNYAGGSDVMARSLYNGGRRVRTRGRNMWLCEQGQTETERDYAADFAREKGP